ncbi:MAG: hypothetical protein Alpg2KO_18770 [Alphaproteobacteria bacterium]
MKAETPDSRVERLARLLKERGQRLQAWEIGQQIRQWLRRREDNVFTLVTTSSPFKRLGAAYQVLADEVRRQRRLLREDATEFLEQHEQADGMRPGFHAVNRKRLAHMIRHAQGQTSWDMIKRGWHILHTEGKWRKAKEKNDFSIVAPRFQQLVEHTRKVANRKAEKLGEFKSPYHALVDEYSPRRIREPFERMVAEVEQWAPQHLKDVQEFNETALGQELEGLDFTVKSEHQAHLFRRVLEKMGLDMDHVEIGEAEHPLCLGTKGNLKITLTYDADNFIYNLLSAVHEGGHALYRQHLPDHWLNHPAAEMPSQSMDEGMALIMENYVGRSRGLASFALKVLKEECGVELPGVTPDLLYQKMLARGVNMKRGAADEVSYPLHVMLRYKLGAELINGEIDAQDLPRRWREEEQRLFGQSSKTDKDGCLQDIHWYGGQFGYFPSYFMGAMISGRLFEQFSKETPDFASQMEQDFDPSALVKWLDRKVYKDSTGEHAMDHVARISGRPLTSDSYRKLAEQRYTDDPDNPALFSAIQSYHRIAEEEARMKRAPARPSASPRFAVGDKAKPGKWDHLSSKPVAPTVDASDQPPQSRLKPRLTRDDGPGFTP